MIYSKKIILKRGISGKVLKNSQQILELTRYGVGASTIAPDVIENLVKNQAVTAAVDVFVKDFENLIGEKNKTMSDC